MPELNPLDGRPLQPGQILVTGDPMTGPRVTVVTIGGTLPRWISKRDQVVNGAVVSSYYDNGLQGGSYQGPQVLPEIRVTAMPTWVILTVLVIVAGVAILKAQGGQSWGSDR